jgi:hypothetical protein
MAKKKIVARKRAQTAERRPSQVPQTSATVNVRVRMYRQGLGDCFLLSFGADKEFENASHVLVDCGTLGATTTGIKIKDVVADITEATKGKLSLLVASHEHLDHLSGFSAAREGFDSLQVDHAWVAWTENPQDELAKKLQKYKGDLGVAALAAHTALKQMADSDEAAELAGALQEVLSFAGEVTLGAAFAKTVDEAMKYVAARAPEGNRKYLNPGTCVQPPWLPGVNVFVLGPPRDERKIRNLGEHGNPELYELSDTSVSSLRATTGWFNYGGTWTDYSKALDAGEKDELDRSLPFDQRYRTYLGDANLKQDSYFDKGNSWRRIDNDWLCSSTDLALQLDNLTNNTSLVLAFEIGEDGPVILMAADAQLGNWLSWHDYTWEVPTATGGVRQLQAKDLLARTVLYKVGHHSSHNATAVQHGLEMMTSDDLMALIPLDKKVAIKKKWPMPAPKLYERLIEKTKGRVLRSDVGWPSDSDRPTSISRSEWKKLPPGVQLSLENEYIDVVLLAGSFRA